MKPVLAEELTPACNVCSSSLEWAAQLLGPSFVYTLRVGEPQVLEARNILRELGCAVKGNPFAPYVNLQVSDDFNFEEWSLETESKTVYSQGCR